jgi:hypothetical protein
LALHNIQRILRQDGLFYATTFGKDGLLNFINHAMFEMGLSDAETIDGISFTLENGSALLRNHFSSVKTESYADHLEMVQPVDLVDYIFSMASMSHVDRSNREKMLAYFEAKKDGTRLLSIPRIYGLFIAKK